MAAVQHSRMHGEVGYAENKDDNQAAHRRLQYGVCARRIEGAVDRRLYNIGDFGCRQSTVASGLVELRMTVLATERIPLITANGWHPQFDRPLIEHCPTARRSKNMKTLALATATLGLALTATPALAGSDDFHSQKVSFAGLDLSTVEGQRMFEQRVDRAARKVCGLDERRIGTLIRSNEAQDCVVKARAAARNQMASIIEDQRRGG